MSNILTSPLKRIAVIGTSLPRQCGIATYTSDLCAAISDGYPQTAVSAIAINDTAAGYDYPETVRFALGQADIGAYRRAADFINLNDFALVSVQHEYGIFGGAAGSHLLVLLRGVNVPIVTTLHTILREPTRQQRLVLSELAELSDRLVVMSERGAEFLRTIYGVDAAKIDVIPHGIPDVAFIDPSFHKDQFNAEGNMVLLTFGLLSQNKGIEHVIMAMPAILAQHPNVIYIVLGATHPHVRQYEGERYRQSLHDLANHLGVSDHVIFHDQFVELDALMDYIGAADVYITPYLTESQIVSGTLAYAVGAGKAVISTPYWYAEEMLADERGILVPFRDASAIASAVDHLLSHEAERHAMRKRAYMLGRGMTWAQVASRYMDSFVQACAEHALITRIATNPLLFQSDHEVPMLRLDHLQRMTDDTGLIQHAILAIPNYNEGYATDDNARGLMAAVMLEEAAPVESYNLASRYMAFLWHAFNPDTQRFRNFMSFDRRWLDESGTEDSHARSLWALGTVLSYSTNPALCGIASTLFARGLPATLALSHPRPWAIALLAMQAYLQRFDGDRTVHHAQLVLAERLLARYQLNRSDDWHWFDQSLTYDNAMLPHALLASGHALGRQDMCDAGFEALRWLTTLQRPAGGYFAPIGCNGFYQRGQAKAQFDQQPLEAQATVLASIEAWRISNDPQWLAEAQTAFEWFLGRNDLGLALYDPTTGGCRDGLESDRVNQNQGAESTLAFLIARLALQQFIPQENLSLEPLIERAVGSHSDYEPAQLRLDKPANRQH